MIRFLSISPVIPYDGIGHAGGKTYNFYLKKLNLSDDVDLNVLAFCRKRDAELCDLEKYHVRYKLIFSSGNFITNMKHLFFDLLGWAMGHSKMFSLYKLREIMAYLKKLKKADSLPDIIELEWTNFVLYAKTIHKKYPSIRLIASEHDVSFLGAQRKQQRAKGFKQLLLKRDCRLLKKEELEALHYCSIVMPQNEKDKMLLVEHGIKAECIFVLTPFYHNMEYIVRSDVNYDILFWGAMYREENYQAALWFIRQVMPLLADTNIRFVVAGNRPPQELIDCQSERIIITGFVEDETSYFEKSLCFVSPLLTGAGIKVKIIEALSAGIPVITNDIGIEGIPAKNCSSYFHCDSPESYEIIIRRLLNGNINLLELQTKQREVVDQYFNLELSVDRYCDVVLRLGCSS